MKDPHEDVDLDNNEWDSYTIITTPDYNDDEYDY